ncbi:MAG: glycosyltransferase family 4 protein [Roseiarcus sp.]|uniref:glycosyltransferase family 4 protein n=1 Tax=Roseiarcus sp. TaxID=1969460 RepID=UPI003C4E2EE0
MAKIIFVNRFFYPDQSATSQILTDLAFFLAEESHEVHVITGRNIVGEKVTKLRRTEIINKVTVHRIGRLGMQSPALVSRSLDFISFYWLGAIQLIKHTTHRSIVVVETDPPLLSIWAWWLLRTRQVRIINWLQDVYPEVAVRFGVRFTRGRVGDFLARLRDQSLRNAAANVVLGSRMAAYIESRGVPRASIRLIPNWVDDRAIHPVESGANPLRKRWGLGNKFVVGYSGNLGRVHEFETVLAAAELLRDHRDLRFLFIGGGFLYEGLKEALRRRSLDKLAIFMPYQDQSELANSLSVPDVHWVSLRPEFEGLIVPSKFYGIAAAGRGAIAITEADGEIAQLIAAHKCGAIITPGDGAALADLLNLMIVDRALGAAWGRNARSMLSAHYSRTQALDRWSQLIRSLDQDSPKATG